MGIDEGLVFGGVFGGEEDGAAAGEAGFHGVSRRCGAAGFGFGAGGLEGVGSVGSELDIGDLRSDGSGCGSLLDGNAGGLLFGEAHGSAAFGAVHMVDAPCTEIEMARWKE